VWTRALETEDELSEREKKGKEGAGGGATVKPRDENDFSQETGKEGGSAAADGFLGKRNGGWAVEGTKASIFARSGESR